MGRRGGAACRCEACGSYPEAPDRFQNSCAGGARPADWPLVDDVGGGFYFKPDAGQIFVSPADATPSPPTDAQPEELDIAHGVDRMTRATALPVPRIIRRWAGLRTFAADGSPVVGPDDAVEGFFWLAGQGGYGIKTAPALSQILAATVLGGEISAAIAASGLTIADLSPQRLRRATGRESATMAAL